MFIRPAFGGCRRRGEYQHVPREVDVTENNNVHMRVKALQQAVDAITANNIVLLALHSTAMIASGEGKNKVWHFVSV